MKKRKREEKEIIRTLESLVVDPSSPLEKQENQIWATFSVF